MLEITERSPGRRYACQSVFLGDSVAIVYREMTEAEEMRRDAEDAAFAERKAAEAGQPKQKTLTEQIQELRLEMQDLARRVQSL